MTSAFFCSPALQIVDSLARQRATTKRSGCDLLTDAKPDARIRAHPAAPRQALTFFWLV